MPVSIPLTGLVFLTIWFTVLFAVLSSNVRSRHQTGDIRRDRSGSAVRAAARRQGYRDNFELGGRFAALVAVADCAG